MPTGGGTGIPREQNRGSFGGGRGFPENKTGGHSGGDGVSPRTKQGVILASPSVCELVGARGARPSERKPGGDSEGLFVTCDVSLVTFPWFWVFFRFFHAFFVAFSWRPFYTCSP